jgi:hypothetical protein
MKYTQTQISLIVATLVTLAGVTLYVNPLNFPEWLRNVWLIAIAVWLINFGALHYYRYSLMRGVRRSRLEMWIMGELLRNPHQTSRQLLNKAKLMPGLVVTPGMFFVALYALRKNRLIQTTPNPIVTDEDRELAADFNEPEPQHGSPFYSLVEDWEDRLRALIR